MSTYNLKPLAKHTPFEGPLLFIIMDGVGLGPQDESDGVFLAYTPTLDKLMAEEPLFTKLKAHGLAVGQPADNDMGNSEVGHNALGAGRIFPQGAKLCNEAIADRRIFDGDTWKQVVSQAKNGGTAHFIGLLSDGNVHSNIQQLLDILDQCAAEKVARVRCHILTDGRDVGEKSALGYIGQLEEKLSACSTDGRDYRIASGGGRMYITMDRYDADWPMVERGWKAHVLGEGRPFASAAEAVQTYYDEDPTVTDQHVHEFVIVEDDKPVGTIEDGDAVVFLNFRGDRALEITRCFEEGDEFTEFDRVRQPNVYYAGIMQYDGDLKLPKNFLVQPSKIKGTISEYFCGVGVKSFAISETQKYGHVTYFWNGNKSGYIAEDLEKFVEIPSDNMTFDKRPWMKAGEITDTLLDAINSGEHKFIRANMPNGDMVGHTGHALAVRISVEAVDLGLERLLVAMKKAGGIAVITADHGNADCLFTVKNGVREAHVAHTLNPVPFIIKDYSGANTFKLREIDTPGLSNVAATLANLLGYEAPEDYDPSLIELA